MSGGISIRRFGWMALLMGVAGCVPAPPAQEAAKAAPAAVPESKPEPEQAAAEAPVALKTAVAMQYMGLLQAIQMHPEALAVQQFAEASSWKPVPEDQLALLNAKVGYSGKLAGQTVLLGSDGTNEVFALSVGKDFVADDIAEAIGSYVQLRPLSSEVTLGQKQQLWVLQEHGAPLGVLMIVSGVGDGIRGAGTVGYMAYDRAVAEMNSP